MKTLKTILIATTMISASVVSTLSAQQAAQPSQHTWKVAKGDSVMIKRECQEYLTGEKPSVWVWACRDPSCPPKWHRGYTPTG